MQHTIIATVCDFIERNQLLCHERRYLVALSGGADSVALMLILHELGYRIEAVHCNFRLRGAEADGDEQFCVDLCERLGVKLHRVHFDTRFYAEQHHVSIEMAARELRYHYFARLANAIGADAVCVAHHQDDSVETVVMNLIRGTGLQGLLGIQPVNGLIVRPLLCVSRNDVEAYLKAIGQPYVIDSTNLEDDAVRNRIRHHILPLMEQINPAAKQNIARTSAILSQVADVYQALISEDAARVVEHRLAPDGITRFDSIDIEKLHACRQPHDTLLYILREKDFQPAQVEAIWQNIHAATGTVYESVSHQLVFDRGFIVVAARLEQEQRAYSFPIESLYKLENGWKISITTEPANPLAVSRDPLVATLDAERVGMPLLLRPARQGDRFQPFGMKGMKLVSDFLTDRKVPLLMKKRQLVMEDASGRIVWIVGQRIDGRCAVNAQTRHVLRIACLPPQQPQSL